MWERIEDRNFSDTARFRTDESSISVSGPDEFMWHLTTENAISEYNTINLRWLIVEFNNEWSTMQPECRVMLGEVPITYVGTVEDMIGIITFILYSGRPDEVVELINEKLTVNTVMCHRVEKSKPDTVVSA
tara:strand:- start:47 stop:439 length:393 start_codon:yes stop_codon:yes gene_type:complete